MDWNYQRDESKGFAIIPEGVYRIRIASAEKAVASTGTQMLTIKFDVSGTNKKLWHNICFLPDRPEITNRNLTQFFDSFKDIPEGERDLSKWVGKVGAAMIKHGEYKGNAKAEIDYFVAKDKQVDLPAWQEPANGANAMLGGGANAAGFAGIDDVVPFP